MAYFEGHPDENAKRNIFKYFFLILIVVIILVFFSVGSIADWKQKLASLLVSAAFIIMIISVVTMKVNPMGWLQIFNSGEFKRFLEADQKIYDQLRRLDDTHFIFYNFNLELLHVESLVICPRGIFVIGRILAPDSLRIEKDILYTGKRPLMKKTSTLWRISHLINIVIQKSYKTEIMPQPVLVAPNAESTGISEYDGLAIVTTADLNALIAASPDNALDMALVEGFARYIKEKYC